MNSINGKIALEGKEITKGFKMGRESLMILKDISIKINVGDFISIMGPSGSGKSTLLYILGGLDKPSTGKVLMNGEDISKFSDDKQSVMRRRNIGFVFQFYNLIPNLNVEENILLPVLLDGNKTKDYKKELDNILEIVGLTERRKHTPKELSGGQQQRVAIARALINNPEIIFADEPTGNLDSKTGTEIMELLRKINRENKKTIIMVTHSMETAEYGNRVVNIKDGGIV
ncbi:ABC transporter ATP-binding protein [Clostridium sporogenes]|uniref:ABC transporter ATP-binding protein n=1 Tax=Clostridium sporogenes TaxID=1509 RepID=UPI0022385429|nr:ABC transporter ATP-binding protein [Clostridium sporogenes]MCW6074819.1 ABC transporter ATP-binding protein [Clostridium sporogenes]